VCLPGAVHALGVGFDRAKRQRGERRRGEQQGGRDDEQRDLKAADRSDSRPTAAAAYESPHKCAISRLIVTAEPRSVGTTTFWPIAVNGPLYRYRQTTARKNDGMNHSTGACNALTTSLAARTNPTMPTSRSERG
jgi:hypothetical protein